MKKETKNKLRMQTVPQVVFCAFNSSKIPSRPQKQFLLWEIHMFLCVTVLHSRKDCCLCLGKTWPQRSGGLLGVS